MEIKKHVNGDEIHIELIGDLDGHSSDAVTIELLEAIQPHGKLFIDMKACSYVSSAGLRTLLTVGKSTKMQEGEMHILNLQEDVKDVMVMTGFSGIFESFK